MPTPPVPADVDLRSFPHMQLDVARVLNCAFTATVSDAAFRAGVRLWCHAWHQVPAASLPASDAVLSNLAGFGRDVAAWLAVKEEAMEGFELCDDGRYYHNFIAKKALEAWAVKRVAKDRANARWSGRDGKDSAEQTPRATKAKSGAALAAAFDRFWEAYPHKVSKEAGRRAFKTAMDRVKGDVERILAGLERYKDSKPADRDWRNPATFLNGGGWDDQPAAPAQPATPPRPVRNIYDII